MTIISTSKARAVLPELIDTLNEKGGAYVVGRRNKPEAILIKFPTEYRPDVSDITLINANSESFGFLKDEPDIYSLDDVKK